MKLLIILLHIQTCVSLKEGLPVFLLDYDNVFTEWNIKANPFIAIDVEFGNIIKESKKLSTFVVLFIEETLCTEDISTRDKFGTPFTNLHTGLKERKVRFIPSVVDPYTVLKKEFRPLQNNVFFMTIGKKLKFSESLSYLYVFFQDQLNKPRAEVLKSHDIIMTDVYRSVREFKNNPIVAFYTAKTNPVVIKNLEFIDLLPFDDEKDPSVMVISDGALFSFAGVFMAKRTRRSEYTEEPAVGNEEWFQNGLSTTLEYSEFELQFNFQFRKSNWIITSVSLMEGGEEVGRKIMGVGAPYRMSYLCDEPLSIINTRDGSTVTISKYKIEPRSSSDSSNSTNSTCFGTSVNCGPYFNTHILSGLLISWICFLITAFGVTILLNCGVNDRLDDPDGKDIIIPTE